MQIGTSVTDKAGKFSVEVIINGQSQPVYAAADGYPYVVGVPGQRYTLRVRNLTPGRLLIVNAIDQRDTGSDKPASHDNGGMVVDAYGETSFDGWRHDNNSVGEFVFGAPEHAVSTQATGDPSGVGVIAFAAFAEQYVEPVYRGGYRSATPRGGIVPEMYRGGVGTGIGDTVASRVHTVTFNRSTSQPISVLEIGYDTEQWLRERGIIAPPRPAGFPVTPAFGGYQKMPR